MAQCEGITRKGAQCKRDAPEGSKYCAIHQDQAVRPRSTSGAQAWDGEAVVATAIGFGLVGLILYLGIRR